MYPAHTLPARSDRAAQSESDKRPEAGKRAASRAAVLPDDKAGSQDDLPLRCKRARVKRLLPSPSHSRRESDSERRILAASHGRRIAVNMRRTHLHPYRRRAPDGPHRLTQNPRRLDARSKDFILMIWCLDAIDRAPDQINQPRIHDMGNNLSLNGQVLPKLTLCQI